MSRARYSKPVCWGIALATSLAIWAGIGVLYAVVLGGLR